MNPAIDQLTENNPNPVLNVKKDGTVLYANEASKSLLNEWSVGVGEKLPSSIVDFVQRAISQSPEKIEVNVGKRVYSLAFHPVPEEECVNVYGFDISDQKELEEIKLRKIEEKYRKGEEQYSALFNARTSAIAHCRVVTNEKGKPIDYIVLKVNDAYEEATGIKKKDIEGRKITEVFPGIECFAYDYIGNFGRVAFEGTELKVEVFLEPLQRWLSIYVYSPIYGEFTAIFTDITERKQADEALRERENQFHVLAEAMPQIVWITRADGWNIYFNQKWAEYTGLTLEESYGHGWNKPFHPDDQKRAWDAWQNAVHNNGSYSLECRLRGADGFYRWWLIRGVPFFNESGAIDKWFGTCTDIHEIKLTAEELREGEERYRSHFNTDAVGTTEIDLTGRFITANDRYCQITGYSRDELLGMNVVELSHPDDRDFDRKLLADYLNGGTPTLDVEKRYVRKDGRVIWIQITASIICDTEGRPLRSTGVVQDITERKQAEKALRESEGRFRTLAENSPDVIARFDRHNRHLYANPAATLPYGHSQKEIIGKTHSELGMDPEKVKFWERHHENVFATGKPETMEFQYKSPQGKEFYFNTRIVPEFADGEVTYVLAISRDVTDIKEAEAKLKETLNNLEKLVEERTVELEKAYNLLKESEGRLAEAQRLAHLGNWDWDIVTGEVY